jgi:outer membrane protein assembly factor BamA
MKKRCCILILLAFVCQQTAAQKRLWDHPLIKRFISSGNDSIRSSGFMVLPIFGFAPETGMELGAAGLYNFYMDPADSLIRTSSLALLSSFTTEKQFNVKMTADVWTADNTWHYMGELRFRNFPFYFYGLGNNTYEADKDLLTQRLIRFAAEAERRIVRHYYAGFTALFEQYRYIDAESGGIYGQMPLHSASGGRFLSTGITQLYDTRNSNVYTTRGFYARLRYLYAPPIWGGEHFSGHRMDLDVRSFFPLTQTLTLGLHSKYETYFNQDIPFYLTPQLGNDAMMRGYYQGRYRDNSLLAAQAELRWRIHPRIGFAVFAAAGNVYRSRLDLSSLKPSAGAGIRYFFDLEHSSSVRIDYAVAEKRPGEARQTGLYLSLAEAF